LLPLDSARLADLRPGRSHGFDAVQVRGIMDGIYARGDRLMLWFLAAHMALAVVFAFYHHTWLQTWAIGGGALAAFAICKTLWPRTFFTRAFAGIAQQAFVALHIYQLYGQSEQHFWYFTAFTMMIVYQDWVCMWPGALLIIAQHSIFAGLHNAGYPVHFFPEPYVGFTKLFFHFGIALVQVAICGYWAHLLREQTLSDAWRRLQLSDGQLLLKHQLVKIQTSEAALKASTDALEESSRRHRAILDNVQDVMWVKDLSGRYTAVNEAFARLFHRQKADFESLTAADLLPADAALVVTEQEAQAIARRMPVSVERDLIVDGKALVLDTTVSPVLDADGNPMGTTGISRDITDRKRVEAERRHAEDQMRHAQKLESLGVLAGGIAHDFNNLLAEILGNAELARRELAPDSSTLALFNDIEASAMRAAELTRQMLAYSGKAQLESRPLDLSATIDAMSDALRKSISGNATLRLQLPPDLPLVDADLSQIQQVVTNLVINASEALKDGVGSITVRTERTEISAGELSRLDAQGEVREGAYVVIEVSDTGVGMFAETKEKMYDPFFTTKFVGRGLGLPAVLGILRGHHGGIIAHSVVGRGTTFRVLFPALTAGGSPAVAPPRAAAPITAEHGREVVLIVDDEPGVLRTATRIIEHAGFSVVTAGDGVEAVALIKERGSSISLVLLDMVMPRLSGLDALRAIREIMPGLPVVLTSGFTGESTADRVGDLELVKFISKPYRMNDLIAAVRTLIGEAAIRS
jgi:two-component system cell cycle sensor histidine kinase/response regulator CckA